MRYKHFHNRLRHFRIINNLKQKEVVHLLGMHHSKLLTKWEQGTAYPSIINLFKLSIVYKTLPPNLYPDLYQALRECLEHKQGARCRSNDNDYI